MDRCLGFALNLCGWLTASQRTRFVNQSGLNKLADFFLFEAEDLNKDISQLSKKKEWFRKVESYSASSQETDRIRPLGPR